MNRLFDKLPVIGGKIPGKITLSFLILLLSVILLLVNRTTDKLLCMLAMLFSFIGDVILNRKVGKDKSLVVGGGAFSIAHIFYFFAYNYLILKCQYAYFNVGVVISLGIMFAIAIGSIMDAKKASKELAFGVFYLWVSSINYVTIASYSCSANSIASLAALGALLFLLSDVIIGLEKFANMKSKIMRELVWWLYPIGQIMIIIFA